MQAQKCEVNPDSTQEKPKSGMVVCACNPSSGEADRQIPGAQWTASFPFLASSTAVSSEIPYLREREGRGRGRGKVDGT